MTFKYLKNRIGAIFIFAVALGTIYFYQSGIVLLPRLLKMQAGGILSLASLATAFTSLREAASS